jgi:thioredoxin 2
MSETLLIRCPNCSATNRVPQAKIEQGFAPVCGRCKTPLSMSSTPVSVTDATFAAEVERSPLPVLLDFWAPWCGPCRILAPTLDQLASDLAGQVRIAKINVDENPRTPARFSVDSFPTLLVLRAGREVDRLIGLRSKAEIQQWLDQING